MFFNTCLGKAQKSTLERHRGKLSKILTRQRKDPENLAAQIFALWECGKWFNLSGYQDKLCCNCHFSHSLSSQWNSGSWLKSNLSHQSFSDCGLQESEVALWNNCNFLPPFFFFLNSHTFIPTHAKKNIPHSARENISNGIKHLHYFYSFISQCFMAAMHRINCVFLFPLNWEILLYIFCRFKIQLSSPLP